MGRINYDEILQTIRFNLMELMNDDDLVSIFEGYRIIVSDEQQFINSFNEKKADHTIFITVKFGSAMTYFNQIALPLTITALSEHNSCKICQKLLTEYALKFSSENFTDGIQQIYESPSVLGNFNEVYTGFRSILSMSATFVLLNNINFCDVTYNYKDENGETQHEKIKTFTSSYHFDNTIDSQAFFNSRNFAKSVGKVGSLSISGATYFFADSQLFSDILDVIMLADESYEGTNPKPYEGVNKPFNLTITFLNSTKSETETTENKKTITANFRLTLFNIDQNMGNVPVAAFGFSK